MFSLVLHSAPTLGLAQTPCVVALIVSKAENVQRVVVALAPVTNVRVQKIERILYFKTDVIISGTYGLHVPQLYLMLATLQLWRYRGMETLLGASIRVKLPRASSCYSLSWCPNHRLLAPIVQTTIAVLSSSHACAEAPRYHATLEDTARRTLAHQAFAKRCSTPLTAR